MVFHLYFVDLHELLRDSDLNDSYGRRFPSLYS